MHIPYRKIKVFQAVQAVLAERRVQLRQQTPCLCDKFVRVRSRVNAHDSIGQISGHLAGHFQFAFRHSQLEALVDVNQAIVQPVTGGTPQIILPAKGDGPFHADDDLCQLPFWNIIPKKLYDDDGT
mmetsp:Transcript_89009/g.133470  ORF Transcript_89009/g.133470 Transcript_89009/m.133470 type:complete len:126 (+) Transcript_89009:807-1184(+)